MSRTRGPTSPLRGYRWIRDLPLLEIEEGAYLSNKATIGTNICLLNGDILVDRHSPNLQNAMYPLRAVCRALVLLPITCVLALTGCQDDPVQPDPGLSPESSHPEFSAAQEDGLIPDQYVIVFKEDVQDVPGLARRMTAAHQGKLKHTYTHALKGFAARLPPQAAAALAKHPHVELVSQDRVVQVVDKQTSPPWGLDRIDQRDLPLSGSYEYMYDGTGVSAYVIDTGIRITHLDFAGRAAYAYTAIGDGYGASDCNGHGTHVAGTIGGSTYGAAKQVTLYSVRVLGCNGSGEGSWVLAGVDWVTANHRKPAVANMSLGTVAGPWAPMDRAVNNSIAAGVTYVVAAGNNNTDACNTSPARVAAAITVGAITTSNDARAPFSNYGTCLDVFAPGVRIYSAWHTSNTAVSGLSGTSMAAPHAAGVVSQHLHNMAVDGSGSSPSEVANRITTWATKDKVVDAGPGSPNRLLTNLGTTVRVQAPDYCARCSVLSLTSAPGGPYTGTEGSATPFDGRRSFDPSGGALSYTWKFGDLTSGSGATPRHAYGDNDTYLVSLSVTNQNGQTASGSTTATIANVAPTVNAGPDVTLDPGKSFGMTASFADPGASDAPWQYTIAWGDGQTSNGTLSDLASRVAGSHTYARAGTYTVQVRVTDKDGGTGSDEAQVTVKNQPPVAHAGGPYSGTEGSVVTVDGSGSYDPDGDPLTYAWDLGDRSTGTGVRPAHAYADDGSYTVALTVEDPHAASHTARTTVSVQNVAPAVNAAAGTTILRGETYEGSGSFADPGADSWSATVDYGDATGVQPLALSGKSFALSHIYRVAGTHSAVVTVTDDDGGSGTGRSTVVVLTPQQALEGMVATISRLVSAGRLGAGEGNSLTAKLQPAIDQLDRNNSVAAKNQISTFIRELDALARSTRMATADAQPLRDMANRVIRSIDAP